MCQYYRIPFKILLTSYYSLFSPSEKKTKKKTPSQKQNQKTQKTTKLSVQKMAIKYWFVKYLDRIIFAHSPSPLLFSDELFSHGTVRFVREKIQRLHDLVGYRTPIVTLRFSVFM